MNLLLILSALLSALSGVGSAARPVVPQALTAQVIGASVAAHAASVRQQRPAQPHPRRVQLAASPRLSVLDLAVAEPIFARRRRE
ncbi:MULTISPECIES: hypothetical protein [Sphingomonas]|uniref:hypothetical protein n=1 Tax=Sphingomonas TaxID=13687 RepID=UPI00083461A2|nr:hypothetical protein [Sphingomonas sp. CCH10-B3]